MLRLGFAVQVGTLIAVGTGIMRPTVISELLNKGSSQLPGMISRLNFMLSKS